MCLMIQWFVIDSTYYVKVEYINVTDSNKPYPHLLNGCPNIECPFDIFSSIYKPRFPANFDIECSKIVPRTPPSKFIWFNNSINLFISGDGGNKKLTVILIIAGIILGLTILAIVRWLHLRRAEHGRSLLSAEVYAHIA